MDELRDSVRRAYERARLRRALPWALPGLALGRLGVLGAGLAVLPIGLVLTASLVVIHWLGNGWDGGLRPGLRLGGASFFAISTWTLVNGTCGARCSASCELFCLIAGTLAGIGLASVAWRGDTKAAVAGTWITAWSAGLACVSLGWSGLVTVGVLLGLSSPVIVGATLRRA